MGNRLFYFLKLMCQMISVGQMINAIDFINLFCLLDIIFFFASSNTLPINSMRFSMETVLSASNKKRSISSFPNRYLYLKIYI